MECRKCAVFYIALLFVLPLPLKGFHFNRSHTVVWFDPFVSTRDISMSNAYDVTGLIPMISKISSKFSKIMIGKMERFGDGAQSQAIIASAVATFNKFHIQPHEKPMELLMTFNFTDPRQDLATTQFANILNQANKANEIYPGTVKRLYFDYRLLADDTVAAAKTYLTNVQTYLASTDYLLGAYLPYEDCAAGYLFPILQYFHEIFFTRAPTYDELESGPERSFHRYTTDFRVCTRKMQLQGREISIGFEGHWSSVVGVDNKENSVDLVKLWNKMNDWAVKSNSTVVLNEAFDNPYKQQKSRQGWWRLVQNPQYYHASQYIFKEKATDVTNTSIPQPRNIDLLPIGGVGTPKGREHTVIWFDPYVSNMDLSSLNNYDEEGLRPLISKISTKFNKIMIGNTNWRDPVNSQEFIASAVATFNKELPSGAAPFEVFMTFGYLQDVELARSPFILMKKLADEANKIYRETVTKLYLDIEEPFSNENITGIKEYLEYAKINLNGSLYELGVRVYIRHCWEERLPPYLVSIFPYVRHISFQYFRSPENSKEPSSAVPEMARYSMGCLLKIREKDANISVGFETGWLYHDGRTLDNNDENLVEFLEKMSDWAVASNLTIVLHEAFDIPMKITRKKMGWWRLVENASYYHSSEFVFQEKINGVKLNTTTIAQTTTTIVPTTTTTEPSSTTTTKPTTTTTEPSSTTATKPYITTTGSSTTTTPPPTSKTEPSSTTTDPPHLTIVQISTTPVPSTMITPPPDKTQSPSSTPEPIPIPTTPLTEKFTNEPDLETSSTPPLSHTSSPGSILPPSPGMDMMSIIFMVLGIILLLFALTLVAMVVFCNSLRRQPADSGISKDYIKEFYEGGGEAVIGEEDCIPGLQKMRYNKDLELSKSSFKIDLKAPLGSGAFGAVYRGSVKKGNEMPVAIKTTKKDSPGTAVSGLLSEIKVMSYIGQHKNIVSMIGAYTKEVKTGKVYLFLELCSLGCLEKYLRKNISSFLPSPEGNQVNNTTVGNRYEDMHVRVNVPGTVECIQTPSMSNAQSESINMKGEKGFSPSPDLYRWSCEIASGMEFLASKHVVHADLATRNVLLNMYRTAKISDFGLSRRLYEYTNYVKSKQEPLPWRWMAPESLRRMEFNEKTDVWAYGVTLWEIYSLGDVPFEGLSWTPDFSAQIVDGLRLPSPTCCDTEMYSRMLKCWNVDPGNRPTFAELKKTFVQA